MFVIMEILKGCFDLYKTLTNVKSVLNKILLICVIFYVCLFWAESLKGILSSHLGMICLLILAVHLKHNGEVVLLMGVGCVWRIEQHFL